jgi:hypothetical protein
MDDSHFRYITKLEAKKNLAVHIHTPSFVHGGQLGGTSLFLQLVKFRQKIGINYYF